MNLAEWRVRRWQYGLCLLLAWGAAAQAGVELAGVRTEGVAIRVFDHRRDKVELHHVPDAHLAAWKEADGTVNLMLPHLENYRMRGPDIEHLSSDPAKVFSSFVQADDLSEDSHDYHHWLAAPYTTDGKTVYAVSHTEWYACLLHDDCKQREFRLGSWTTTNNLFKSVDGGKSWARQVAQGRSLIFDGAHHWTGSPALEQRAYRRAMNNTGFMVPTRPIREGDYFYVIGLEAQRDFSRIDSASGQAPTVQNGFAILRTRNLAEPVGWEVWSGGGEYRPARLENLQVFAPSERGRPVRVALPQIVFDEKTGRYVLFFTVRGERKGLYYATSRTLAAPEWSEAARVAGTDELVLDPDSTQPRDECNLGLIPQNYPSIIDGDSRGNNFEFTDGDPWMFYVVSQARCGGANMKRDIFRIRLRFDYRSVP